MVTANLYMQRCLQLAELGHRNTGKNPLVGSVLVYNNIIIGEGYHERFGEAHAEVNCINSVKKENSHLISDATLYVNLEPCNHTGKTPPCSMAIIAAGIKKVIVGTEDINSKVAGKGIEKLRQHGIDVTVGICEKESFKLNRIFFTNQKEKRAYIKLKWAQTANGFLGERGKQTSITNNYTNIINHKYRTRADGILIGFNTAKIDNPKLNSRQWEGKQPSRIILDWNCELPIENINPTQNRTIVLNSKKDDITTEIEYHKIEKSPRAIAEKLYELDICSILIEGGAKTHDFFIKENLWDEAIIINSDTILKGDCVPAAKIKSGDYISQQQIFNNTINQYSNSVFLK